MCDLKKKLLNRKRRDAFALRPTTSCDLMTVRQSISYVVISSSRGLAREKGEWGKGLDSLRPRGICDRNTKRRNLKTLYYLWS